MNRIRAIATTGIVAGSVALAAALISSGGVGASFVDAAEAGASITVADHLEGLDSNCDFKIYVGHGEHRKGVNFSDLLDLSRFGTYDGNGNYSATFDFDLSSPNFSALWAIALSGDLNATWTHEGNKLSVTFTWSVTSLLPLKGSAEIVLTCTPLSGDDGSSGNGGSGYKMNSMSIAGGDSISSLSMGLNSDPSTGSDTSTGNSNATGAPETFTFEAVIDLPADDQPEPDCAPGDADVTDLVKCPPATTTLAPTTTTAAATTSPAATIPPATTPPSDPQEPPDTTESPDTSAPPVTTKLPPVEPPATTTPDPTS